MPNPVGIGGDAGGGDFISAGEALPSQDAAYAGVSSFGFGGTNAHAEAEVSLKESRMRVGTRPGARTL